MVNTRVVPVVRAMIALAPLLAVAPAAAQSMTLRETVPLTVYGAGWKIDGVGDFDGDGSPETLWRRATNEGAMIIETAGGQYWGRRFVPRLPSGKATAMPAPGWKVVGIGDFNGDGSSDILSRRQNDTGEARIWIMNPKELVASDGTTLSPFDLRQDIGLPTTPAGWSVAGVGDFNGDGYADVLWWNASTGDLRAAVLAGDRLEALGSARPGPMSMLLLDAPLGRFPGFRVVGVGDLNGDGHADLVMRRDSDGYLAVYFVTPYPAYDELHPTSLSVTGYWLLTGTWTSAWTVAGVADFDGDGKADLLLRQTNLTGALYVARFPTDGRTFEGTYRYLGLVRPSSTVRVADFDADRVDLFWHDTANAGQALQQRVERRFADVALPVPTAAQVESNWCWATTGQMIMNYVSRGEKNPSQCEQASNRWFDGSPTTVGQFFGSCCNKPWSTTAIRATEPRSQADACNRPGGPEYGRYGFVVRHKPHGTPLTLKELVTEFRRDRPVSFAWGWDSGDGHVMVARGVTTDPAGVAWISVNDPSGGTTMEVNFNAYVNGPDSSNAAYYKLGAGHGGFGSHHFHGDDLGLRYVGVASTLRSAASSAWGSGAPPVASFAAAPPAGDTSGAPPSAGAQGAAPGAPLSEIPPSAAPGQHDSR